MELQQHWWRLAVFAVIVFVVLLSSRQQKAALQIRATPLSYKYQDVAEVPAVVSQQKKVKPPAPREEEEPQRETQPAVPDTSPRAEQPQDVMAPLLNSLERLTNLMEERLRQKAVARRRNRDTGKKATAGAVVSRQQADACPDKAPVEVLLYSKFTPSNPRYAYVTYVSSSEFVAAAAVLLHSIAMTGTNYARAVLVTSKVGEHDRLRLGTLAQVIEVERVTHRHRIPDERYFEVFNKLRLWQLVMFDKIVYFDSDVIVVRNSDELFDLDGWSVPMDADQPRYSTGMMVLQPSEETFNDMMLALDKTKVNMGLPDLLFLTEYFAQRGNKGTALASADASQPRVAANKINIIARWYQVYQEEFAAQRKSYLTNGREPVEIFDARVHGIHYPGPRKPWQRLRERQKLYGPFFCKWRSAEQFKFDPNFLWHLHYHWMLETLGRETVTFEAESGVVVRLENTLVQRHKDERSQDGFFDRLKAELKAQFEGARTQPHESEEQGTTLRVRLASRNVAAFVASGDVRPRLLIALTEDVEQALGLDRGSLWVRDSLTLTDAVRVEYNIDPEVAKGMTLPEDRTKSIAVPKLTVMFEASPAKEKVEVFIVAAPGVTVQRASAVRSKQPAAQQVVAPNSFTDPEDMSADSSGSEAAGAS